MHVNQALFCSLFIGGSGSLAVCRGRPGRSGHV